MDQSDCRRTYFTVLDEDGVGHPAMEYLAATLDEQPVFQVLPLKRFVKLIGSGEHLEAAGDGRFVSSRSRRTYVEKGRRVDPELRPAPAAVSAAPSTRSG